MKAGHTAHLDLDTHAGQAWVALRVMIRPFQPQPNQLFPKKSRNPAYYRRQERRKAARKAADASTKPNEANAEEAIAPDSMKVAEKATVPDNTKAAEAITEEAIISDNIEIAEEAIIPDNAEAAEEATIPDKKEATEERNANKAKDPVTEFENIITCDTEEAKNNTNKPVSHTVSFDSLGRVNSGDRPPIPQTQRFKCTLCDFGFDSERDLNTHITSKHTKINQLDGNVSLLEDNEKYLSFLNPIEDTEEIKNSTSKPVSHTVSFDSLGRVNSGDSSDNLGRGNRGDYPNVQRFKCTLCNLGFDSERDLNNHITSKHTKIDQFDGNVSLLEVNEMKEDDEGQDLKEVTKNLIKSSNETKQYKCDLCDYSFGNKRGLKIHLSRKHTKPVDPATLGLNQFTQHATSPEETDKVSESTCSDEISEPLEEVSVNFSEDQNLFDPDQYFEDFKQELHQSFNRFDSLVDRLQSKKNNVADQYTQYPQYTMWGWSSF